MTAIEKTAYHRFKRTYTARELSELFTPTSEEIWFAEFTARTTRLRFCLLVQVKCFLHLGYFPATDDIPEVVLTHIRSCVQLTHEEASFVYENARTLYRHRTLVREHLGIREYGKAARHQAVMAVYAAAQRMERPADLINVAIELLVKERYEQSAFSTLDTLARRVRFLVNEGFFARITTQLSARDRATLDDLFVVSPTAMKSGFARLKERPGNVTPMHMRQWEQHLVWLESLMNAAPLLQDVPTIKISQWAAEARAPDAQTIAAIASPKRFVVLVCLLHEEQMAARDALTTMFIRTVSSLHDRGQAKLDEIRKRQRQVIEELITTLDGIARSQLNEGETPDDARFGELVRAYLDGVGGAQAVHDQCQSVMELRKSNYLPLLGPIYAPARALLFKIVHTLHIHPSSSDDRVAQALAVVLANEGRRSKQIDGTLILSFASEDWQRLIIPSMEGGRRFNRQALEICVFSAVATELKTGDLWVEGAGEFADLRAQLLSREECQAKIAEYCEQVGLPATAHDFVVVLRQQLTAMAAEVDRSYPDNHAMTVSPHGEVLLKRRRSPEVPQSVLALEAALIEEMPIRSVLEGLRNVQHWTNFAQFFGPLSGAEPKLADPVAKYLLTVFGYATNMGPTQLSRHIKGVMSAATVGRVNARHITIATLDRATQRIIDTYAACELPYSWGSAKVASADGTMQELRAGNLMTEYHVRYGRFGGIAFHYVSSLYIALLSHFIPCRAWEGIHLIDAYLHNQSQVQPDTLHTDTQGQSGPIWATAYMLGINLMPRIRNWRGVTMYRPDAQTRYQHIDALFTGMVDWDFIEHYWEDLMQAMISIKEGKILPSTLLRKLSNYSHKNKLYQIFKAVGDVVRTIFLLRYISRMEVREMITQETNKVEGYHHFCDWVTFASDAILTGMDDDSFTKRVKYTDVLANALILHTMVDMSVALKTLQQRGWIIAPETVAQLSPYLTRNWQRFGEYDVDMHTEPPPLASLVRLVTTVDS